ncbi:GAF domain-containing protein [Pseudoalteromonas luteoviolacea]|uniref:GAF domain-containing protein n=1 Tax=Pseudoalteromonas luteoviolacea S4054 TaxID=1129367 RepID=A0A0F6A715_9GAMM|nr:GAF domain-containing protein [Pseudoalteromonas luteoviolacea]AOT08154.1 hypothetical protein S4054249_09985 [Pseudoalteromonas luteoviolacea]AOT13071.1 hypothetical protein S40542_09985 [Pseudoalteromonas luteoviolacea]AOT17983.1 hypothetical protein S4054_09980 [Pseudoalteromonas luteoviolacea]KKE81646.1 hypothetical protein N479_21735 [Pseudoalteromonas luteoviolacea S4054]KZN69479.1 hypothetical protein N481_22065 [Pseudoalteromonas luteoviolacea S4047-1]
MIDVETLDQIPFNNFEEASRSTLRYLKKRYGYGIWMMTRKHEQEWIILHVDGDKYQIQELTTLVWSDSLCSRMVKGQGPRWAGIVEDVEAYKTAPIFHAQNIQSYVGIPILYANGELFGTLCAIDTEPVFNQPAEAPQTVELISKLLSSLLQVELRTVLASRQQVGHLPKQLTDSATGFLNRLGWSLYIEKEESDIRAIGTPVYIIALDIIGAGKDGIVEQKDIPLLVSIIQTNLSNYGFIARLGENIFTLLVADKTQEQFDKLVHSFAQDMTDSHIKFSIGIQKHPYSASLESTVVSAIKNVAKYEKLKGE